MSTLAKPTTFDVGYHFVLKNEGWDSDRESDPGGATRAGLSVNLLQRIRDDNGLLVYDKDGDGDVDADDIRLLENKDIEGFYHTMWQKRRLDEINDPQAAIKILDMCTLLGFGRTSRAVQQGLHALGHRHIKIDGVMGSTTIRFLNIENGIGNPVLPVLCSEMWGYLRTRPHVSENPGWFPRSYKHPEISYDPL